VLHAELCSRERTKRKLLRLVEQQYLEEARRAIRVLYTVPPERLSLVSLFAKIAAHAYSPPTA
jgi:hypothetical protein